jgi:hypothetical protein
MAEYVPVKAYIPRTLRRRAFAAFALFDTNYSQWTREHLEAWLRQVTSQAILLSGEEGQADRTPNVPQR